MMVISFFSCNEKKQKPTFYDYPSSDNIEEKDSTPTEDSSSYFSVIPVPYTDDCGVKKVDVKVNGIPMKMIFDTGCSTALISVVEANFLYKSGLLTDDDIEGVTQSQIADGSIVNNAVVNLKEVQIGDLVCTDVQATVSSNSNAPLLLGNTVLNRVSSCTIDNENHTINFKVRN